MSVPASQFTPPLFFPLGVHTFVLYVCVSWKDIANVVFFSSSNDSHRKFLLMPFEMLWK